MTPPEPTIPDYAGACTANLVPALLGNPNGPTDWLPQEALDADQVVVLVLDGLGWEQLVPRWSAMPTAAKMISRPITTVAPSTTSTALTSIATGRTPGEHGVIGYRLAVGREVLNILRWSTARGDARHTIPPESICSLDPFEAQRPPVVTRAEFEHSGFTEAHLARTRFVGYRMPSTLVAEVGRLLRSGEPFVYAYYDGIDKVAHEYGIREHYDVELAATDLILEYLIAGLPKGAALVVTADHGHLDIGDAVRRPDPEVMSFVDFQSGEARFRWLHAMAGSESELLTAARKHHSDTSWVRSVDEVIDEGWFGPVVTDATRSRLGDVAIVPFEPIAFDEPTDTGPYDLVGRHGSLTSGEVLVPLLVAYNS